MKAERRHELQTNSLAMWAQIRLPELWAKYGNHVLIGLIIIVAGIWFVRWRIEAPKVAAVRATQILGGVEQSINALEGGAKPSSESADIPNRVAEALRTTDDPDLKAQAYVLLGEYHWALATMPPSPEAMTRPSLSPDQSPDELYKLCDENMASALATGTKQPDLIARANVMRAMVAEQRGFALSQKGPGSEPAKNKAFADARASYQAIVDTPDMPEVLKQEAQVKLRALAQMEEPLWLVDRAPTTLPAGPLGPEAPPTTAPTTRPAK